MLRPSDHLTKRYQGVIYVWAYTDCGTAHTCYEDLKTLIDRIITNHSQRGTNTGIIPCSIVSDHDVIYTCVNLRPPWFHPRYKFIRDFRNFNEDMFKEDFSTLPLSLIYHLNDPDEQLREWHVLKAAHKAIYSHDWPRNLQLEQVKHARNLRSSSTINLVIPYASDTFQYSTAALVSQC